MNAVFYLMTIEMPATWCKNSNLMSVPCHQLRMLADHAFYTTDDRPGSVVNDRNFHHRNAVADPDDQTDLPDDRQSRIWLESREMCLSLAVFREPTNARVAQW